MTPLPLAARSGPQAAKPDRAMSDPLATHTHSPDDLAATLEFVKRTRAELRILRKVRLWTDRLHIIDVNKDFFQILGLGYASSDVLPVLKSINAVYNPDTIHTPTPTDAEYKEFDTGRRHPWAEDRVM
jgi:hypothetical protein